MLKQAVRKPLEAVLRYLGELPSHPRARPAVSLPAPPLPLKSPGFPMPTPRPQGRLPAGWEVCPALQQPLREGPRGLGLLSPSAGSARGLGGAGRPALPGLAVFASQFLLLPWRPSLSKDIPEP